MQMQKLPKIYIKRKHIYSNANVFMYRILYRYFNLIRKEYYRRVIYTIYNKKLNVCKCKSGH